MYLFGNSLITCREICGFIECRPTSTWPNGVIAFIYFGFFLNHFKIATACHVLTCSSSAHVNFYVFCMFLPSTRCLFNVSQVITCCRLRADVTIYVSLSVQYYELMLMST